MFNLRWNMKRGAERAGLPAPSCFDLPLLLKAQKAGLRGLNLPVTELLPTEEVFLYSYADSLLTHPGVVEAMTNEQWEQLAANSRAQKDTPTWRPAPHPSLLDLTGSPTPTPSQTTPISPAPSPLVSALLDFGRAVLASRTNTPAYTPAPPSSSGAGAGVGAPLLSR